LCGLVADDEPENAAIDRVQEPSPDFEHRRFDLVVVVETTKHKAAFGQAELATRWLRRRDGAPGIVRLVAVGQSHDVLDEA
jgi:hypothetical protein